MADSVVTGSGKLMDFSTETGSYEYVATSIDQDTSDPPEPTTVQQLVTVSYTDVRETRKWYNLTETAIDNYIIANPSENIQAFLSDEFIDDTYEMLKEDVTRTITDVTVTAVPEAP
jgi:hypothetical protein